MGVLVLSPTRELAQQTYNVLKMLTAGLHNEIGNSALIIGGSSETHQKKVLLKYPSIVIATPGNILYKRMYKILVI